MAKKWTTITFSVHADDDKPIQDDLDRVPAKERSARVREVYYAGLRAMKAVPANYVRTSSADKSGNDYTEVKSMLAQIMELLKGGRLVVEDADGNTSPVPPQLAAHLDSMFSDGGEYE